MVGELRKIVFDVDVVVGWKGRGKELNELFRSVIQKVCEKEKDNGAEFCALCEKIEEIFNDDDYLVSKDEIFTFMDLSTGMKSLCLSVHNFCVTLVDIGNQSNKRDKWIHMFQDVESVFFFVSLAKYSLHF